MNMKLKKLFIALSFFLVIVNALFGKVSQVFAAPPVPTGTLVTSGEVMAHNGCSPAPVYIKLECRSDLHSTYVGDIPILE